MSGPPSTKNGVALEAMVHLKILATNATFRDKWMPPEAWATALDVKFGVEYSKRVVSIALNGLETNQSFPNPNNANETIVLQEHHFNVTMATNKESKCRFFLFRLSTTNQANELVAAKRKDLWQKAYNDAMKFIQPRRTSKRLRHEEPPPPPPPSSSLQAEQLLEMKVAETIQLLSMQSKEHVPPTTLSCALDMARVAWDNFYPPSLAFPLALLLSTATTGPGPSEVTLDDCTDIKTLGDSDGFTTSDETNNSGGRIKTSDIKLSTLDSKAKQKEPLQQDNEDSAEDVAPSSKRRKQEGRIRGAEAVNHVVSTALKLVATVASVAGSMEPSDFVKQCEKIVKSLNSKDKSLEQIRQNHLVAKYSHFLGKPLKENQKTKQKGVGLTSRARGRILLSDLTEAKHGKLIDQELWCRHIIPYVVKEIAKKMLMHPIQLQHKDNNGKWLPQGTTTPHSSVGVRDRGVTFTDKKNLLIADEERFFYLEHPDKSIEDFDTKSFMVRGFFVKEVGGVKIHEPIDFNVD